MWTRPAGFAVFVVALTLGARSEPRPGVHGEGLLVLLALIGGAVGSIGLVANALDRKLPFLLRIVFFGVLVGSSVTLVWIVPDGPGFVGGFIAAGVAASTLPGRAGTAVAVGTLVALGVAGIAGAHRPLTSILVSELGAVAFYRLGLYARQLRARTKQAESLLVELERSREAQLGAATMAERQRLAREMHDVLAHSLSGLLLHLEGARLLATREAVDPRLTDTIERARHLAEAGLGEARQAIGMLRDEDLPGPERLRALAGEFARDSGIRCDLAVSGTPHDLGPQTRLTLYRVAQEALTNVRKHARPDHVEVRLSYEPGGTRLSVEDFTTDAVPTDPGGAASSDGTVPTDGQLDDHGYGVSGMRERAELLGGTLTAAPTSNGFRVVLWVPGGHG